MSPPSSELASPAPLPPASMSPPPGTKGGGGGGQHLLEGEGAGRPMRTNGEKASYNLCYILWYILQLYVWLQNVLIHKCIRKLKHFLKFFSYYGKRSKIARPMSTYVHMYLWVIIRFGKSRIAIRIKAGHIRKLFDKSRRTLSIDIVSPQFSING